MTRRFRFTSFHGVPTGRLVRPSDAAEGADMSPRAFATLVAIWFGFVAMTLLAALAARPWHSF